MTKQEARFWFTIGFHYTADFDEESDPAVVDNPGFEDLYDAWAATQPAVSATARVVNNLIDAREFADIPAEIRAMSGVPDVVLSPNTKGRRCGVKTEQRECGELLKWRIARPTRSSGYECAVCDMVYLNHGFCTNLVDKKEEVE